MYAITNFVMSVCFILAIIYAVLYFKRRKTDHKRANKYALIAWIMVFLSLLGYWGNGLTPEAKKESLQESRESSIQAKKDAVQKAKQKAKQKSVQRINKYHHTHGLSGLKYQADKYLKKDDSVAFYHPVKVLGYDDSKPYNANIEFKANNESKATMKDGALSILEGIKKADYQDFSNITISFTQNVSNAYGQNLKNIPVLGYSFHRKTLKLMHPSNMDSSDLDKVADSHFDKHVAGD